MIKNNISLLLDEHEHLHYIEKKQYLIRLNTKHVGSNVDDNTDTLCMSESTKKVLRKTLEVEFSKFREVVKVLTFFYVE